MTLNEVYGKKVDVWGFGVVCWEMLSGDKPFPHIEDGNRVAAMVAAGDRLTIPPFVGDSLRLLITVPPVLFSSHPLLTLSSPSHR